MVCISIWPVVMFCEDEFTCRFMKLHPGPGMSEGLGRDMEGIWFPNSSWRNSLCRFWSSVRRLLSWACSSAKEGFLRHTAYNYTCVQMNPKQKKRQHLLLKGICQYFLATELSISSSSILASSSCNLSCSFFSLASVMFFLCKSQWQNNYTVKS